jgi:valyl-tRNA synthetase
VTGSRLPICHGFKTGLIESLARYQRLPGKNVLCRPDTHHATIQGSLRSE